MDLAERAHLIRRSQAGDSNAKERLLTDLRPILREVAFEFNIRGYAQEDKEQEATIVAIRAIDTYDGSKGASLPHWVRKLVRQRFTDLFRHADRKGLPATLSLDADEDAEDPEDRAARFDNRDGGLEPRFAKVWAALTNPVSTPKPLSDAFLLVSSRWMHADAVAVLAQPFKRDAVLPVRRRGESPSRLFARAYLVFVKVVSVVVAAAAQGDRNSSTDSLLGRLLRSNCRGVSEMVLAGLACVWEDDEAQQ